MPRYDFDRPRLFLEAALVEGAIVALGREHANYLRNVLRLGDGAEVLAFNGLHGEWLMRLGVEGKKAASLEAIQQTRPQTPPADLDYVFAPLKHARLDYMVQKATEMGASRLIPAMTRRTQATRVNIERMRANAVEAAEQCGVLSVPEVVEARPLETILRGWPAERALVFCDEDEPVADPVAALREKLGKKTPPIALAVLVGPEGGFDPGERQAIKSLPQAVTIALGPRILRADTAAVAALAVVQAAVGDWNAPE
ncbi:MAG: 16S rRNA (uracil(1498)-N(3))-methyltransferase [Beijerinckiaceae bacterium]